MGRTATFKANEGYRGPTGMVPAKTEGPENAGLLNEGQETVSTTGEAPLAASTPVEVNAGAQIPSELDNTAAENSSEDAGEWEPTPEEVERFNKLQEEGMSEAEAAAEVWPDIELVEEGSEEVTETSEEDNSDAGSTDETAESEETPEEVTVQDYPAGEPTTQWKVAEIDAWAAAQTPAIEFTSGSTKNQKLDQLKGRND